MYVTLILCVCIYILNHQVYFFLLLASNQWEGFVTCHKLHIDMFLQ